MYMHCRVVFDRGTGDMSSSLDFSVPLTGIESVIPGWDAFNPLGTNFVVNSTNNNHAALLAIFSVLNQGLILAVTYLLV